MFFLIVGLSACAEPGVVEIADFRLRLRPVVPGNEAPFEALDHIDLLVQPEAGEAVRTSFEVLSSGATPVAEGIPALENAVIYVEGYVGDDLTAWGRTEALTASTGEIDAAVLVAETDRAAWLGPLTDPVMGGLLVALGEGRFFFGGGVNEGTGTTLEQSLDTTAVLSLAPPEDTLAFADSGTLPTYLDSYDGDELRARYGATLTPITLGNDAGRFLLVGGGGGPGYTRGADLTRDVQVFDAVAGTWTLARESDQLEIARGDHLAIGNAQGAVVVAGGWTVAAPDAYAVTQTIEVWDPATGGFAPAQAAPELGSLDLVGADLGVDGTLICGGAFFDDGEWFSTNHCVEVGLDGAVDDGPDLPAALTASAMITLPDGRILLTGGVTQGSRFGLEEEPAPAARADAWVYVGNGTWQAVSRMALPRAGHRMAVLPDGRVLVAGGAPTYSPVRVPQEAYACLEIFDPTTNTFTLVDDCTGDDAAVGLAGRAYKPSIAVDSEFGALVVGGANANGTGEFASSQVTLYTPEHAP